MRTLLITIYKNKPVFENFVICHCIFVGAGVFVGIVIGKATDSWMPFFFSIINLLFFSGSFGIVTVIVKELSSEEKNGWLHTMVMGCYVAILTYGTMIFLLIAHLNGSKFRIF